LAGCATCFFLEGREALTISSSLLLSEEVGGSFFLICLGATTATGAAVILTVEFLLPATLVAGVFASTLSAEASSASPAYLAFSYNFLAIFSAFFSAFVLGTSPDFSACFPAVSAPFERLCFCF